MGIGLGIFDSPSGSGVMAADFATRAENLVISTNEHGLERCSFEVPMSLWEAFSWYDPNGLPWVKATWNGLSLAAGRLEDRRIKDGSVSFQALGPWRSLMDVPYTALWSDTGLDGWEIQNRDIYGPTAQAEKFEQDTNNRLYMTPKKNETFGNAPAVLGFFGYIIPYASARKITGIQFDYEFLAPVNWRVLVQSRDGAWGTASATLLTLNGNAAVQAESLHITLTATDRITFRMDYNAANAAYAADTGAAYIRITNIRLVTSTANRVNTTFSANTAAGTIVVTPVSMAHITVGLRLFIATGAAGNSESVVVTAVTGATFTATFVNTHTAGQLIQAHVVYADEVAKDIAATVNALNSAQLSTSSALVQSPGLDLTDEVYEDASPADVLTTLASYGDNASPPNMYEVGVEVADTPQLFFRPIGSAGQTWYVDVSDIDVERSLEALANSVYPVYQDVNDRTLRNAPSADTNTTRRYGLTRQRALAVRTTSSTQASSQASASLADTKDPTPRAGIVFSALYDSAGARHMLFEAQAQDTIVIRNLPPSLATTIDRIRSFRIGRTEYHADDDTLTVEPATPIPSLEFMLSRLTIGART